MQAVPRSFGISSLDVIFAIGQRLMIFIGSHHLALLYNSTVRQKTQKHLFHLPLTWHETTRNAGLGDIQRTGSLRKMGWLARAWLRAMISWVLGIPGLTSSNGSVLGSLSHRTVSVPSHLGYLGADVPGQLPGHTNFAFVKLKGK